MKSRRHFLRLTAATLTAAGLAPIQSKAAMIKSAQAPAFTLGMAGYTFKEFSLDQVISMMTRLEMRNLSLKDFHLPLTSTQAEVDAVMEKFREAGITVYAPGVVYMKSEADVDQAFSYVQRMHCPMIVGAPNYELLPYVEKKVKETDVRVAIHNHGPDNPLYPNATDIWNHIQKLDPRIGICLDIGHTTRDGQDPSTDLDRYFPRIFDIHIKDVTANTKEGKTIEMGRGIIDIPRFVRMLLKKGYSGRCSLEFEKDMKDPLPGIAESLGFFKGVVRTLA